MRRGVTDHATGVHFRTFVRTAKARGFAKCNHCEFLKAKIRRAPNKTKRSVYVRRLDQHYQKVSADREELARIARFIMFVLSQLVSAESSQVVC